MNRKLHHLSVWTLLFCVCHAARPVVAVDGPVKVEVKRNVPVSMRDGVVLRANVFRPDRGGPFPVLVMRTPYGKRTRGVERYVKAGYIVVS